MGTNSLYSDEKWKIISSNLATNMYVVKTPKGNIINISGNTAVIVIEGDGNYRQYLGKPLQEVAHGEIITNVNRNANM